MNSLNVAVPSLNNENYGGEKGYFIPKSRILILLHSGSHCENQDESQRPCMAQLFQL